VDLCEPNRGALAGLGHSFKLSHKDFGGVTSGVYEFGSNVLAVNAPPASPSMLRLGHVLSDTENGRVHPAPEDPDALFGEVTYIADSKVLHPGGLMPIKALRSKILCYSVFSPTKWVARALTLEELKRCLDTSEIQLGERDSHRVSSVPFNRLPFILSPPGRLVRAVAGVLTCRSKQKHVPTQLDSQSSEAHSIPEEATSMHHDEETDPDDYIERDIDVTFGREKAAKNDDADVAVMDWDERVFKLWHPHGLVKERRRGFEERFDKDVLSVLRQFALRRWRLNLLRSFGNYMTATYPAPWSNAPIDNALKEVWTKDVQAAADCLRRAAGASWWDWDQGSRLFFWRWPVEARVWARDGLPIYHQPSRLPNYRTRQPPEPDPLVRTRVREKLDKFRGKRYVNCGTAMSLTPFFTVPKGDGDVRVVFDGTKSKLNDALWAPPFVLPTIVSLLRCVEPGTWMADIDIGEMFYNYSLDSRIQPYCGVDISPYFDGVTTWEVWTRCVMGIRSSPHGCTLMEMIGDEMARGDPKDPRNPFAYDLVRLNLPGSADYRPNLPWVSKVVSVTGRIAPDVKTYVDDKRVTGPTQALCEAATRRAASFLTYLGEQDASRKRVSASRRAGAWAGSVCHTDEDVVTVMVTTDKWDKAKGHITHLLKVATTSNVFLYKELESIRGFLVYVVRTYPAFNPYLKGIHLTLDSWRTGRRWDGWKAEAEEDVLNSAMGDTYCGEHPTTVKGVPRLALDLQALATLFNHHKPPRRTVRTKEVAVVWYGYGDASRSGFGSSFITPSGVRLRYGLWGRDLSHQSSNFREMRNLVDALDYELEDQFPVLQSAVSAVSAMVHQDNMHGLEIFLFTDNIVAECAFYRGSSSNPRLFDLILQLKQLEIRYSLQLHVVHIAGSRMMAQGTDGLSRGASWELENPLELVPLHRSSLERDPGLLPWLISWAPLNGSLHTLAPADWFRLGHGICGDIANHDGIWTPRLLPSDSILLWHPAPAAAEVALEELCMSRHKRPLLRHVFVCPRLYTHAWRKRLFKSADLVFNLSPGFLPGVWANHQHEPLVVGIFLPYRTSPPGVMKDTLPLLGIQDRLRRSFATRDSNLHVVLADLWLTPCFPCHFKPSGPGQHLA